jgi:hypothetical protein
MKARAILAAEEEKLHEDGDAMDILRFLDPDVVPQIRPYITAANDLILKQLIPLGTLDSLTEALCNMRHILIADTRSITVLKTSCHSSDCDLIKMKSASLCGVLATAIDNLVQWALPLSISALTKSNHRLIPTFFTETDSH